MARFDLTAEPMGQEPLDPNARAATHLFEAASEIQPEIRALSEQSSKVAVQLVRSLESREQRALAMLAVTCGYALRLAQDDEAPVEVNLPPADSNRALVDLVDRRRDPLFWNFFTPGERVWQLVTELLAQDLDARGAEPSLIESSMDMIDQTMRLGYLAAVVDRHYCLPPTLGSSPRATTAPQATWLQRTFVAVLPHRRIWMPSVLGIYVLCRPTFLVCIAAAANLGGEQTAQAAAISMAGINLLAQVAMFRWFWGPFYVVKLASGLTGVGLLIYSFFV